MQRESDTVGRKGLGFCSEVGQRAGLYRREWEKSVEFSVILKAAAAQSEIAFEITAFKSRRERISPLVTAFKYAIVCKIDVFSWRAELLGRIVLYKQLHLFTG